jgi:ABC-type thiamine transport system substrate-binding protein
MPTLNYMYPAISGRDLPNDAGYRHHSVVPVDATVSPTEINANISDWLDDWDKAMA